MHINRRKKKELGGDWEERYEEQESYEVPAMQPPPEIDRDGGEEWA